MCNIKDIGYSDKLNTIKTERELHVYVGYNPRAAEHVYITHRSTLPKDCDMECPICIESLGEGIAVRLPCGHDLHMTCYFQWSREYKHPQCPLCKRAVEGSPYEVLSYHVATDVAVFEKSYSCLRFWRRQRPRRVVPLPPKRCCGGKQAVAYVSTVYPEFVPVVEDGSYICSNVVVDK